MLHFKDVIFDMETGDPDDYLTLYAIPSIFLYIP